MTDFDAIDALLAGAKQEVPLPPAKERRALREGLNLSRTQLAKALNVSASTVGGWESGRDPSGEAREKYAYFLERARTKLAAAAAEEAPGEEPGDDGLAEAEPNVEQDDVEALPAPQACVLCGQPARHQVAGFPQHLNPLPSAAQPSPRSPRSPRLRRSQGSRCPRAGRAGQRAGSRSCPSAAVCRQPTPRT